MKFGISILFAIHIFFLCQVYAISIENKTHHNLKSAVAYESGIHLSFNASKNLEMQQPSRNAHSKSHHHNTTHIHLASWRWDDYGQILVLTMILVLAGIIKLGFHHTPILSNYVPESCALIIAGIFLGSFVYANDMSDENGYDAVQQYFPRFSSNAFFLVLLPPIILDSTYSIYNRHFLDNLGDILVFALMGTLFNAFCIGYGLYLVNYLGLMGELPEEMSTITSLKFAALISAVDPVAVLAIFQDIGVNISLYFMVFGESLLNDGVSIVLYNSMGSLGEIAASSEDDSIDNINYILAILSFFTVVFGGLLVGMCIGFAASYIVKFTEHIQVIEPFLILAMSYLSYVLAETLHWSGIISLIGCGIVQKRYAFLNISKTSLYTIKHAVATLATFSDCIIFLFLGVVTVSRPNDLQWHWGFSLWTCFLCLIIRFAGVFLLSAILNFKRVKKISIKEQIIIGYGGLRGAVGFSLAIIFYQDDGGELSKIFLTTTLFMVYFTVFLQGGTIKILVEKLNIEKEKEKVRLISDDVNSKTIDLLMAGVGSVLGKMHYTAFLENLQSFDKKFIKMWLVRSNVLDSMTERLNKISIEEHFARLYGPNAPAHQKELSCILKSIIPANDIFTKSSVGRGRSHHNLEMDNSSIHTTNMKPQEDKTFKFENVVMEKIMLQKAFSQCPYERIRESKYNSIPIIGSIKTRNDSDEDLENVLKEHKEQTRAIWRSAITRISLQSQAEPSVISCQSEH
jgi:sodium/hydrogen exchanger 3